MKERKHERKNQFYAYKKHIAQFLKNGFNPVLGSIPHLPFADGNSWLIAQKGKKIN